MKIQLPKNTLFIGLYIGDVFSITIDGKRGFA